MTNKEAVEIIKGIATWEYWQGRTMEALNLAIKALETVGNSDKLQGEWIDCGNYYKCPFCENWVLEVDGKPNYCDECGADMRKPNCVTCDDFGKDCGKCERGDEE